MRLCLFAEMAVPFELEATGAVDCLEVADQRTVNSKDGLLAGVPWAASAVKSTTVDLSVNSAACPVATVVARSLTSGKALDDMVWNEFGEPNGDHVVPDPNPDSNPDSTQFSWLPNEGRCKRVSREPSQSASTLRDSTTSTTGVADSVSDTSRTGHFSEEDESEEELLLQDTAMPSPLIGDKWTDLAGVKADLPAAGSKPFGSDQPPGSRETEDVAVGEQTKDHQCPMKEEVVLYICEDDASMDTDPFSMSDVGSQDRSLAMFGNENASNKADSLLELGWENIGNLDDMERLFRNDSSSFEPGMVNGTDALDWPSSSPPTVNTMDCGMEFDKSSPRTERPAVKVEAEAVEDKEATQSVYGERLPVLAKSCSDDIVADSGSPKSLNNNPVSVPAKQQALPRADKRDRSREAKSSDAILPGNARTKDEATQSSGSFPEVGKGNLAQAYRARRHAANRKRSEERFKRSTSYRKLSPGPPYNVCNADVRHIHSLPLRLSGQPPHLHSSPGYPIQFFPPSLAPGLIGAPHQLQIPHGGPYIQVGYPIHHMSTISSGPSTSLMHTQHAPPMYADIQQPGLQVQKQPVLLPQPTLLAGSRPFDASSRPPTSSPSMTKQEKLEKLRWRQQMQARIAVEQQHQLLASQNGDGTEAPMHHKQQQAMGQGLVSSQPGNPSTPTGSSERLLNPPSEADQRLAVTGVDVPSTSHREVVEEFSIEGSVLGQLKSTISALDSGTRICIRDALYRLARSAMKRRAGGGENTSEGSEEHDSDANAVESSTASGPPSSRHSRDTSMSVVETQTNPIDRSIAKLLFSKPVPALFSRPFAYS